MEHINIISPCPKFVALILKSLLSFTNLYMKNPAYERQRISQIDADSKTDTILERLRDLSKEHIYIFF